MTCPHPPYPTEDAAFDVLELAPDVLAQEREPTPAVPGIHVGVYACLHCGAFHIGQFVVFWEPPI